MASDAIKYNHIPEIIKKLPQIQDKLVRAAAFNIERAAKRNAPVDTGLLKNSIYTVTARESGFTASAEAARHRIVHDFKLAKRESTQARQFARRNKEERAFASALFPEVAALGPGHALVLVGAVYGIFVEFGTVHMRAQPFLLPAAVDEQHNFAAAWRKLEALLRDEGMGK